MPTDRYPVTSPVPVAVVSCFRSAVTILNEGAARAYLSDVPAGNGGLPLEAGANLQWAADRPLWAHVEADTATSLVVTDMLMSLGPSAGSPTSPTTVVNHSTTVVNAPYYGGAAPGWDAVPRFPVTMWSDGGGVGTGEASMPTTPAYESVGDVHVTFQIVDKGTAVSPEYYTVMYWRVWFVHGGVAGETHGGDYVLGTSPTVVTANLPAGYLFDHISVASTDAVTDDAAWIHWYPAGHPLRPVGPIGADPALSFDTSGFASVVVTPYDLSAGVTTVTCAWGDDEAGVHEVGDTAVWDASTAEACWVLPVKGRHLVVTPSSSTGASVPLTVWLSAQHLTDRWSNQVSVGSGGVHQAGVVLPAGIAESTLVPVSTASGPCRVRVWLGEAAGAGVYAWVQRVTDPVHVMNALTYTVLSDDGDAAHVTMDFTPPREPVGVVCGCRTEASPGATGTITTTSGSTA